jgi:hypothetical protein
MTVEPDADILVEARRLVAASDSGGTPLRVTGGVAVALHSRSLPPSLRRAYRDIDLVAQRKRGPETGKLLKALGYETNDRFNAMNGGSRLIAYDTTNARQIDVFVGEFHMCHRIPIADRLELDPTTVPLAELLLTKLQIVNLNPKDLIDIYALLLEHEVSDHDDDAVNADHIAVILGGDWGLWRTSRQVVETARAKLGEHDLSEDQVSVIDGRLSRIWGAVEARPKSMRWRSRARLGDRARWYDDPEEIAHREL